MTVTGSGENDSLVNGEDNVVAPEAGVSLTCLVFGNCDENKPANNVDKIDTNNTEIAEDEVTIIAATLDEDEEILDDDEDDDVEAAQIPAGSCVFEDDVYSNYATVPSDDPCKICYCNSGEIICASQECLAPSGYEDCTPMAAPEGQCCPIQYECGNKDKV